ncbi:hypothetical protein [Kocuria aegyptia]|uniref:Uncharacterized protein n=1 Tax=Kocuria aegyptia TaxID=330943 RepID=A0ABP4X6I2_9MICC
MSNALSFPSTTRSVDLVHVPLLPGSPERPDEACADSAGGDVGLHPAGLLQRVFTAAGEVETAEWALDQVLEAAASGEEVGIGLDVAPLDGALESAHWALDRAVEALRAELRRAARRGVPLALLAEASATDVGELRCLLHPSDALTGPDLAPGGLAAAG